MKKVLFVLNYMGVGGVAKALINLLKLLNDEKNLDIDLLLFKKNGVYLSEIPNSINVIESKGLLQCFGMSQEESKRIGKFTYLKRSTCALWSKLFTNKILLKSCFRKNKLKTKYDLAVAFSHSHHQRTLSEGCIEYILNCVDANKKVAVCHADPIEEALLTKYNIKNFLKLNKLFFVSKSCMQKAVDKCKELKGIADYLYNVFDEKEIKDKLKGDNIIFNKEVINIISVSRLSEEKGYLRSLNVFKTLIEEGYNNFCWHIVGSGSEKENIENFINEHNLKEFVELCGYQINPYKYIIASDLFYLGSYHEAAPMVFAESMTCGIPVLTTNTCSAYELVGEKGFVCENNEDSIYQAIKKILVNSQTLDEKKEILNDYKYDNLAIKEKFLKQIN